MFKHNAGQITRSLIANGVIAESDFELYNFGFEMALSIAANIITTIFIGILFKMPMESLLFLTAFIPLRSYVGGFHAPNHFNCYWLSVVAVVAVLLASRFVLSVYNIAAVIIIGIICSAIMFMLVPVQDANRPLDDIEILVYGRRARIVICVEIFTLITLISLGFETAVSVLICVLILTCLTVCMGAIKNYIKPLS